MITLIPQHNQVLSIVLREKWAACAARTTTFELCA
jgi:hypothetical protein